MTHDDCNTCRSKNTCPYYYPDAVCTLDSHQDPFEQEFGVYEDNAYE